MIEKRVSENESFIYYDFNYEGDELANGLYPVGNAEEINQPGLYCFLESDGILPREGLKGLMYDDDGVVVYRFRYSGDYYYYQEPTATDLVFKKIAIIPTEDWHHPTVPSKELQIVAEYPPLKTSEEEENEEEIDIFSGTYVHPHYCCVCDEITYPDDPDDWQEVCVFCGTPF